MIDRLKSASTDWSLSETWKASSLLKVAVETVIEGKRHSVVELL